MDEQKPISQPPGGPPAPSPGRLPILSVTLEPTGEFTTTFSLVWANPRSYGTPLALAANAIAAEFSKRNGMTHHAALLAIRIGLNREWKGMIRQMLRSGKRPTATPDPDGWPDGYDSLQRVELAMEADVELAKCPPCGGTGTYMYSGDCVRCGGTGKHKEER